MVTIETFRQMALSFPAAEKQDHWGRPSFRVKKKIFSTLWPVEKRAVLKFSVIDQSVFCAFNTSIIYPVEGGWGRKGYTIIELSKIKKTMLKDMLTSAWCTVAPKTMVAKFITTGM